MNDREELLAATARVHHADGALNYMLELYGDELAQEQGYRKHEGLDAIRFYLMEQHGWLPRDVRTMSLDDLRFAIEEKMGDWTAPRNLAKLYPPEK